MASTMLPPSGGGEPPSGPPLVGIQSFTDLDVLCGRGVTTNRHPGNTKFRSLVGCNKEVYVSSTKKQKMLISRSIVTAVRGLGGRFLEMDRETGLYFDIGDKKAVEKCSQALRDGAAALRKQLSEDLNDPDFLNAVFDGPDNTPAVAVNGPAKNQKAKKGHRRVKSTPVIMSTSQSYEARRKSREQRRADPGGSASSIFSAAQEPVSASSVFAAAFDASEYDDILPPLPPPQPRKHHRSHRRVHSSTSAPVFGGYDGNSHPLRPDDPPFLYPEHDSHPFHQSLPPDSHHPFMTNEAPPSRSSDHPFMMNEAPPRLENVGFGKQAGGGDDLILQEPILDIPFTDYDDAPLDALGGGDAEDILASLVPDEDLLASLMASEELLPSTDDDDDDKAGTSEKRIMTV